MKRYFLHFSTSRPRRALRASDRMAMSPASATSHGGARLVRRRRELVRRILFTTQAT